MGLLVVFSQPPVDTPYQHSPDDRSSLAIAYSSRHIGLNMLIEAITRGQDVLELVIAYILASAVVSIPYVRWIKNRRT